MCSMVGSARFASKCTSHIHSWELAFPALSHPSLPGNSAACSPWQCFDMLGSTSTRALAHFWFLNTLISRRSILGDFDFTSSRLWRLKPGGAGTYYIAVTPQSPESPHWPFISKALSEEDKGSVCPGNQVVASPGQTLFTANLPGTQSSAAWTMVCVLWYLSHSRFGQFESHDPGPHDLGAPIRGWPTISQWPHEKIRSSYDQILSLKNLNSNIWEEISNMQSKVKQDAARKRSQGAVM